VGAVAVGDGDTTWLDSPVTIAEAVSDRSVDADDDAGEFGIAAEDVEPQPAPAVAMTTRIAPRKINRPRLPLSNIEPLLDDNSNSRRSDVSPQL
jgi:hypothetical protein